MALSNVFVVDWPKKIAVWLGLATLLPLIAHSGAAALFPPPDYEAYNIARSSLNDGLSSPLPAEKSAAHEKLDEIAKEEHNAEIQFGRRLFWACYCVGLVGVTLGLFIPVRPVGAGLMFGGIIAIGNGCYDAWDKVGRWRRFDSLVLALVVFFVLSVIRFRKSTEP